MNPFLRHSLWCLSRAFDHEYRRNEIFPTLVYMVIAAFIILVAIDTQTNSWHSVFVIVTAVLYFCANAAFLLDHFTVVSNTQDVYDTFFGKDDES